MCVRIRSLGRRVVVIFCSNNLGLYSKQREREIVDEMTGLESICVCLCVTDSEGQRETGWEREPRHTGFWRGHHLAMGSKAHQA